MLAKFFSVLVSGLTTAALVAGCTTGVGGTAAPEPSDSNPAAIGLPTPVLPPAAAKFDYQLGGAYDPPNGVTVVARDRLAPPSGAGYDICYINGFQTQPADSEAFRQAHPELLVQIDGQPVRDPKWTDEYLYDTSSPQNREALASLVKPWIEGCKSAGYSAVEIDNLDSFLRSQGKLTAEQNILLAAEYARLAHSSGLAIAQKNTKEYSKEMRGAGYDFAVAESCFRWEECTEYLDHYPVVLDIEYTDELGASAFPAACQSPDRPTAMIIRDHYLVAAKDPDYYYRTC
ncbi:endo alpha-1,4 polygalactosaminidase [Arthrobacter russicus]|jgi:hypothetical protein|uniref:Glycoside-hydrolase family GH114 TIM-barrel domain-containing protein n=1 Tax=Arthrobacter russicus TaxID=172040 RepID=A0ABU1J6E5_9MICC|nr:endo alpha-1,4 polygalactosaminidase [Arthrobacter russicus]MDR6267995.1 hypothetical protein [Arthrobacter russicus]